jgi:pSer/pThr/pTyr-binding forkhead associated (FHA) protein
MYYRLIRINTAQGGKSQSWVLSLPAIVGRGEEASVCIDDESISRSHCQLYLGPDECLVVRDHGSTNGTYVNGDRITQTHSLVPGDALQLGSVTLMVEYSSDPDPGLTPKKRVSTTATQPMRTIPKPIVRQAPVQESTKRWWEFWKA